MEDPTAHIAEELRQAQSKLQNRQSLMLKQLREEDRRRGVSYMGLQNQRPLGTIGRLHTGALETAHVIDRDETVRGTSSRGSLSTLIIVNVTMEHDPLRSWTFPTTTLTWNEICAKARPPTNHQQGALLFVPWVIVSASHAAQNVTLHAEVLREIMVGVAHKHTVIDGASTIEGKSFWVTWSPSSPGPRSSIAHTVEGPSMINHSSKKFPGELLPVLDLLPQYRALSRRQTENEHL